MKTYPPDSVFVTGVARVSKEDAINAMYGTFTLSLVVDVKTGTIINCSANMIMSDTIDFLRQIIEGKNLVTDTDLITDLLKKRFLALSQKAVVAALKDAQNRFLMAIPGADLARGPWGRRGIGFPFCPLAGRLSFSRLTPWSRHYRKEVHQSSFTACPYILLTHLHQEKEESS